MLPSLEQIDAQLLKLGVKLPPAVDFEREPEWHHPGQKRAWADNHRFLIIIAGTRGGKTRFGPDWLIREMQRKGPGDYAIVGPTLALLIPNAVELFARVWKANGLGTHVKHPYNQFVVSREGAIKLWGDPNASGKVRTGYAENPDSLEAAEYLAVWSDEGGQNAYKRASWDALRRRLSTSIGRHLMTTTPYSVNWLKTDLYDNRERGEGPTRTGDPEIGVIHFESIENPVFPREEWDNARRTLPGWKFDLFYRAIFTRPAGAIFDILDADKHRRPPGKYPVEWPRRAGIDFGGNNTAAVVGLHEPRADTVAADGTQTPTPPRRVVYGDYWPGVQLDEKVHAKAIIELAGQTPAAWGGSHQEVGWRSAFAAHGLPIKEPKHSGKGSVELRIQAIYSALADESLVISSDCTKLWDQLSSYTRKVDADGKVLEEIDDQSAYHLVDALGYWLINEYTPRKGTSITPKRNSWL